MVAHLQPAIGGGRSITDFRPACAINDKLRKDLGASSEFDYRWALKADPVKAKELQQTNITSQPYFQTSCPDLGGGVTTPAPFSGFSVMPGRPLQ
jgi:hypothetical protein